VTPPTGSPDAPELDAAPLAGAVDGVLLAHADPSIIAETLTVISRKLRGVLHTSDLIVRSSFGT